jgi:rhomboid domain-containing protein 1
MSRNSNRNNRARQASPLLLSMGLQIFSELQNAGYNPPVTIFLIIMNVFVHIAPYPYLFGFDLSNTWQNCLDPGKILHSFFVERKLLVNRLVLSSIIHADDVHLYYNMLSLTWKGINLEKHLGSVRFSKLVLFSVLCSHSVVVLMAFALDLFGVHGSVSGINSCAVGFSAVLFSMKYVWNEISPGSSNVMGFSVPTKWAAWVELVVISLLTPNVSFMGHLAGILAGVLYMKYARYWSFM